MPDFGDLLFFLAFLPLAPVGDFDLEAFVLVSFVWFCMRRDWLFCVGLAVWIVLFYFLFCCIRLVVYLRLAWAEISGVCDLKVE